MNLQLLSLETDIIFKWFERLIADSIAELEGKSFENGKLDYYKQEFFKQYCIHFVSIRTLANGLKLTYKGRENEISALAPVSVLIRAGLENYSMFYYIFRDSTELAGTHFRFWSWFREGLMFRQRLNVDGLNEKLDDEKREIERIFNDLSQYPLYELFTKKQKQRYLKDGTWCFLSKRELLAKAGFSKNLSNNCYNFFSSYTHPTSSSHIQTSQADYETSNTIMDTMLKPLFICSGLYLLHYSEMFQDICKLLNEKDNDFIDSWRKLGNELMK